jgi:hypothetical protein
MLDNPFSQIGFQKSIVGNPTAHVDPQQKSDAHQHLEERSTQQC